MENNTSMEREGKGRGREEREEDQRWIEKWKSKSYLCLVMKGDCNKVKSIVVQSRWVGFAACCVE